MKESGNHAVPYEESGESNFTDWFEGSKVTRPGSATPLVVYHGTGDDFTVFDKEKRGSVNETTDSKLGFFFTSCTHRANRAAEDAGYPGGENVRPSYLRIVNPFIYEGAQGLPSETATIINRAINEGHDGVIFGQGELGGKDYVVFEPEQIISAICPGLSCQMVVQNGSVAKTLAERAIAMLDTVDKAHASRKSPGA